MNSKPSISRLLAHGEVSSIAAKLNLSLAATSAALRRANPGHPAVQEALRLAKESGAIEASQTLASLMAA